MSPTGDSIQYVAGGGTITPRLADDVLYRKAHDPRPPKPTGLDWDALTPTCRDCTIKSGQIDASGLCPACRGDKPAAVAKGKPTRYGDSYQVLDAEDVAARFTAPTQSPQGEAASDDAAAIPARESDSELHDEQPVHPRPAAPAVRAKVRRVGTHDVVFILHATTDPIDQVQIAGLLSDLLHSLTPQSPAAATSTATAGHKSEGRRPVGKQARPSDAPAAAIRAWAHANGFLGREHRNGRLPASVRDAYTAAHATKETP